MKRDNTINVCGLIHQFYPYMGGAEIEAYNTYNSITGNFNCSVHVVTSKEDGMKKKEYFKENYSATYLPLTPYFCRNYTYPIIAFLNQFLSKNEFDLYHGWFGAPGGVVATEVAKKKKKPSVVTTIGQDIYDPVVKHNFFVKRAVVRAIRDADKVVALSHDIKRRTQELGKRDDVVIINIGLNLDEYSEKYSKEEKETVMKKYNNINREFVITICRLVERKGIEYLINAIPDILREYPDTNFVIVGDGPEREKLKSLANKNNVSSNVIFTGKIPTNDLIILMREASLFTLPSLFEGLCNAYLEAMACDIPIVATRCGGNEDSLIHNKNSVLVPIQDSKLLSKAIIEVLGDHKLSKSLIMNGRKILREKFDIKVTAEKYFRIYEELKV